MKGLKIIGTGAALPRKRVHNDDLARLTDTSDSWIYPRTGIHERRFCEKDESALTLAIEAGRQALQRAALSPEDIDVVVVASMSPDFATPAMACLTAAALELRSGIPALDINAACSGFVYGLEVARGLLDCAGGRHALLIGTEQLSRLLDIQDRSTAVLFGDGAGAVVLKADASDTEDNVFGSKKSDYLTILGSRGDIAILAPAVYTGAFDGFYADDTEDPEKPTGNAAGEKHRKVDHLLMEGKDVFLFAIDIIPKCVAEILEKTGLSLSDIDHVVCHQANSRIIRNVVRHLKARPGQFFENMERLGNTSGASIPLALAEMEEKGMLQKGRRLLLVGFGGGLTWGASLITYAGTAGENGGEK